MQAQMNTSRLNMMDVLFQDFDGHSIYGVELVLDELGERTKTTAMKKNNDDVDWFGLWDLCI
ncbi:MAG: hypothetical protein ACU84J_04380 [Gammaproteobacteria bacterium]